MAGDVYIGIRGGVVFHFIWVSLGPPYVGRDVVVGPINGGRGGSNLTRDGSKQAGGGAHGPRDYVATHGPLWAPRGLSISRN